MVIRSSANVDKQFMENESMANPTDNIDNVENKACQYEYDGKKDDRRGMMMDNDMNGMSDRRIKFFLTLFACSFIASLIVWLQVSKVSSTHRRKERGNSGMVQAMEEHDWIGDSKFDMIGRSLAVSKDGSIVAIGGRNLLKIYQKQSSNDDDVNKMTWTLMEGGHIRQSDEEFNQSNLGAGVALSEDGFVAAVCGDFGKGMVRVFEYETTVLHLDRDNHDTSTSKWVRKGSDIVNPTGEVGFDSIALSSDGNTLIVSSTGDSDFPNDSDKDSEFIAIYKYNDGTSDWQLQQKIKHANGPYGFSLSMTQQANRFALGARDNNYAAVYELKYNTSDNSQRYEVVSEIQGEDEFGYDVALNSIDGTVLVVGTPSMSNFRGGAMVYKYDPSYQQYIMHQIITYHPTIHSLKHDFIKINGQKEQIKPFEMGHALALSGDATVLAIAPNYENTFVQIYHKKGDEYILVSEMDQIIPASRYTQIAFSQNGKYLAVGLSDDGSEGDNRGQVTIYSLYL